MRPVRNSQGLLWRPASAGPGRTAIALVCLLAGGAAAVAQAPWPTESRPAPLPARDVKFPAYEMRTLPNGLQVVAVLHHEQPVVSMRMLVRAGSALDPKGKPGLSTVAAALLTQGTTTKSARQMNDEMDFIGGEMNAGAGPDLTFINTVVMKDSFETGLQMLSDMARHPAFAQEEIARQRQQMVSGLQVSLDDPEFVGNAVFDRLVYGVHPYGLPDSGTPETLATITRDDLVAFHRRNFVANNAILAIVGDVTADEAFDGVARVFGDWERRDVSMPAVTPVPGAARRVVVVNKPDAVQTEVRVGHVGVRRNHPDYMALNLAIRILGGEGANRLHQILRTERGLAYGAQAYMHTLKDSGDFMAATSTRSDATGEVLRLIVGQFQRLQRERVSDRELSDAKAYLTGSFPLTIETPDAIATQVLNVLFYGLPVEELQSFRDRVNRVGPADIERVARAYLMPDRLSIVLVGNAAAFTNQLRGAGFSTFDMIDMNNLDLTATDFKRPRSRADVGPGGPGGAGGPGRAGRAGEPGGAGRAGRAGEPGRADGRNAYSEYQSPSTTQTGRAAAAEDLADARGLLERVIAAKGGVETLRAVRTISAVTRSRMATPSGPVDAEVTTYLQYPNRVRVETTIPGATIVQAYDGSRGWIKDPNGLHDVPAQMIRDLESGFKRDTVLLLLAAHDGNLRPRLLPDVRDDRGALQHVLELSSLTLDPVVLRIDPDTSLITSEIYVAGGVGQPLVQEQFSDYRTVDGVQLAFTARVQTAGQPSLERRVTSITVNPPLDPKLFTRPPS
jgi:zinc protease